MKHKIKKNKFLNVSQIEPGEMRRFMMNEVGERSQDKIYNFLKDLVNSYPKFHEWYNNTIIHEVELKNGEREIITVFSTLHSGNVALTGIAILKKKQSEKKICTFRIHEDYRNQGIGTALFEKCFEYLETRKPIITISSDRKKMFESHIKYFDFQETQVLNDFYKIGSTEYVYNGYLRKP